MEMNPLSAKAYPLNKAPTVEKEAVDKAAKDFEAVFIAQMLQPMFATVGVDEMFGGGSGEEMWRGMMVEQVGKDIASNGGLGLGDTIRAQMLKLQEVQNGTH
jgi:Rod binding domain-containing protein